MRNKSSLFKDMLLSKRVEFLMEAHNGISAKIVEEAGFNGIWASSLAISAALGVRDSNEASWTQVLEIVEFMNDATNLPILVDADTGYGNFNNVRRLVKKLEQRGIAAMCIEDKLFPKTNSFINSEQQPLASINEFTGKIAAAKDTQTNPHFCVISRTDALIAGRSLSEALKRANAYIKAGADGILIHSKDADAENIVRFMKEWASKAPVVIVPTTYYTTPTHIFEEIGISIVIWANHLFRSSITAMKKTAMEIHLNQSVADTDDKIVSLNEIFRLQNVEELIEAESIYLKRTGNKKIAKKHK